MLILLIMYYVHHFNPVALSLGPMSIRWYGLAYLVGILCSFYIIKIIKKDILTDEQLESMAQHSVMGIILGGRLGYCLFYNFSFYLHNPLEILMVWHGGMSFHGGLLGVICATYIFAIKENLSLLNLTDLIAYGMPAGLFFGRIANFINGELVGRVCSEGFCVIFPKYDLQPRYPSQIYEAIGEGLILGVLLFILRKRIHQTGCISAIFLMYYGFIRLMLEQFREPDIQLGYLLFGLTMGQCLSFIMLFVGFYLLSIIFKSPKNSYGL